jgi:16S rRNA processing protein RimM
MMVVSMKGKQFIAVGKFGAAHGLKGAIKLNSYMQDPESIFDYDVLYDAAGKTTYLINYIGAAKQQFLVKVEGITSKEAAAALTNHYLYMPAEYLPEITEDEGFYITDLVGCNVIHHDKTDIIGTVKAVHNFGAGDILEIQPQAGVGFMVLFTKANFPLCDVVTQQITYCPPELLDATHHDNV